MLLGWIGYLLQKAISSELGNVTDLLDKQKYRQQLRQNKVSEEHVPDEGTR